MSSVANEQECERFSIDAVIDEPALREIYLRPFEMLVRSNNPPCCVMTAYNSVNGVHMDMNSQIIQNILRDEWKFHGMVMSDWGGANSTVESVLAGCDLEMPGPPALRGAKLLNALPGKRGAMLEAAIDRSCERILLLAKKHNLLGLSASQVRASRSRPEMSATTPEDLRRLRRTVANGHVLLKNSASTLPLKPDHLQGKKIAFVGPNAKICSPGGGGSATMNPQYQSHPMEAFERALSELNVNAEVRYAVGAHSMKWLPLASIDQWTSSPGLEGEHESNVFQIDFFVSSDLSGPIFETQFRSNSNIDLTDSGPACLRESGKPYSLRVTSIVRPRTSGMHAFSITSVGHSRLSVDDKCLIDNFDWTERGEAFYAFSSTEARESMHMKAGQSYKVVIEASCKFPDASHDEPVHVWSMQPSVRLGFLEELPATLISDAVAVSNECDYTIAVIGLNDEWESEGYDRQTMALPGKQNELVEALLARTNNAHNVIIVNQSGSAVEMPWADKANTILQAWYGGQEAGNALADVLLGSVNPSGRLPFTWPRRYSDLHFERSKEAWPGVNGRVHYTEGRDVGYRWYQKHDVEPQWWFGHGIGYSSFSITVIDLAERPRERWKLKIEVANTGDVEGQEVVQCYTWPQTRSNAKELRCLGKTSPLAVGSKETLLLHINLRDMAHWKDGRWHLEAGSYSIGIGKNAGPEADLVTTVELPKSQSWDP